MIDFLNKLFGKQSSGATAKERLRLVLMSDHLSLAPEMIESMKRDLVDVISRYVEVDRSKIDVHFENQDNALAMLANIPITGVSRNNGTPPEPPTSSGTSGTASPEAAAVAADLSTRHGEPVEPRPSIAEATRTPRRKKRKKQGGQGHQSGAPAPAPAPAT